MKVILFRSLLTNVSLEALFATRFRAVILNAYTHSFVRRVINGALALCSLTRPGQKKERGRVHDEKQNSKVARHYKNNTKHIYNQPGQGPRVSVTQDTVQLSRNK